MTVDEILAGWEVDGKVDRFDLGSSLLDVADKRGKYLHILFDENAELRRLKAKHSQLVHLKTEYFGGFLNGTDELRELGWEPFKRTILRADVDRHVQVDRQVVKLAEMVGDQKEKISVVMGILDAIKSLSFDIRGRMEWEKFTGGA